MCPKSFGGVRFDLGALLEGQMWSFIPYNNGVYHSVCHTSTMSHPGIHCVEMQYLVID